ncbi:MAG: amidohydrolase family protein [Gammaproteobacteria bacterium]|nr:amidohydrolase family protein [Gammaproteobacteria bacterium]MBU1444540.1 amidohydrolase family protein [Gammaproteobacteria bacterium]MBU2287156.1 amidohydrolase family protein [Gammaproteobacteria bacterium]MBU2408334.1 amidohydrolase family protein [Gammaproteobacteria bacterium]
MSTLQRQAVSAPFSAGEGVTRALVPPGACDCHVHVYDDRYPAADGVRLRPPNASVADYRRVQSRIATERAVFVTPSTYGTDNRPMCEALARFGPEARGVAVIDASTDDAMLDALQVAGVRGIRMNLSHGLANSPSELEALCRRVEPYGWHLQLLASPDRLDSLAQPLMHLPIPVVFDHFGRIAPSQAERHPAHRLILRLLDTGRAWVKLSGSYIVSEVGSPGYGDVAALARAYLDAAPERVVWGSDWPHASASAGHQALPDDAQQMDLLSDWVGDSSALKRVLVDNTAVLYGFQLADPIHS